MRAVGLYGLILTCAFGFGWQPVKEVFLRSWHIGNRRVHEQTHRLSLSCGGESRYEKTVKDAEGREAFKLLAYPLDGCDAAGTWGWVVSLRETDDGASRELLRPTNDPLQDYFTSRDFPGLFSSNWQDPIDPKGIALNDVRIVEVEDFFCILTPLLFEADSKGNGKFDAVQIEVRLSNECEGCKDR